MKRTLLAVANYNTAEYISQLLFSLFRVVGKQRLVQNKIDILIIDNNSTDQSAYILQQFEAQGLIRVIYNKEQMYHGPALNQAVYLAHKEGYRYFWCMDSDVVVLRRRIVNALGYMRKHRAHAIAQFNGDSPHVSCMILDLDYLRKVGARFHHAGNPSRKLIGCIRRHDGVVLNFPFRNCYHILHVGCGTRNVIKITNDRSNEWCTDMADTSPWYHGDRLAPKLHEQFKELYYREVPSRDKLLEACNGPLLSMELPDKSPGRDPAILSPTMRGRLNKIR